MQTARCLTVKAVAKCSQRKGSCVEEAKRLYKEETGKEPVEHVPNQSGDGETCYFTNDFVYWVVEKLDEAWSEIGKIIRKDMGL